jgi:hypothetical protein
MKLTFIDGEENYQVIENIEARENSIFKDQYVVADKVFNDLMKKDNSRKYCNVLAFCGDRGSGKTSCMMSFIKQRVDVDNSNCFSLPVIDPSFFDENHNIVELVIGQMYAEVQDQKGTNNNYNSDVRDDLIILFNSVMIYLKYLAKPDQKENYYDGLQELEALSVGLKLQQEIQQLFGKFLEYVNKETLVITIDDLDLNINGAYIMAEHVRKYLTNEKSIILLSVKIEQLIDAVDITIQREQNGESLESYEMAVKYVTKLIPVSSRVNMPGLEEYCNKELSYMFKNDDGQELNEDYHSVKEAVTHSIFWKTGYLFYNRKGRSSLIVPSTLRSLRQLLHMLHRMSLHDKTKPEEHKRNQGQFKRYFFNTWVQQLDIEERRIAQRIANLSSDTSFNKSVLANLSTLSILRENNNFRSLLDPANYSHNVSLGDVMNVLEYLSQNENDKQLQMLVFFIRSVYSIKLYESYDYVSEDINKNLYPENENAVGEIYSSDAMFEHLNNIQRVVNGQYFNFSLNTVLPPQLVKGAEPQSRDKRLINGDELIKSIKELGANRKPEEEAYQSKFRLVEFFMLTVSHLVNIKKRTDNWDAKTNSAIPSYIMPFNSGAKNMVFDILAPFYNLLNIRATYSRFDSHFCQKAGDITIYDFASQQEWSLLNSIQQKNGRNNDDYDDKKHASLSDIVIRNAEILSALMELIRINRYKSYSSQNVKCIEEFYDSIRNSGMRTYPRYSKDHPYQINFSFLSVFHNLLRECDPDDFDNIYGRQSTVENIVESLFTSSSYAQSTILDKLCKKLKEVYQKRPRKEWMQLFPDEKKHRREDIIDVINQIQRN